MVLVAFRKPASTSLLSKAHHIVPIGEWWHDLEKYKGSHLFIEESNHSDALYKGIVSSFPNVFVDAKTIGLPFFRGVVKEDWSIAKVVVEDMPYGWEKEFTGPHIEHISNVIDEYLKETKSIFFPLKQNLFNAFHLTPLHEVRVAIIGQDPYPGEHNGQPQAQGACFSVDKSVPIPSSLRNIFKEIASDIKGYQVPDHGDLTNWARQGVLLLNTCLTVRPGMAGSHSKYKVWLPLMDVIFKAIAAVNPKCIYLLWGKESQSFSPYLGSDSIILTAAHPSGLSANRGFFGCRHFSKVNEILAKDPRGPIKW